MTVIEIMAELIRHGAQLHADGEDLIIRAPKGAALPDRVRLAEHKEGMLAHCCETYQQDVRSYIHSPMARSLCGFCISSRRTVWLITSCMRSESPLKLMLLL